LLVVDEILNSMGSKGPSGELIFTWSILGVDIIGHPETIRMFLNETGSPPNACNISYTKYFFSNRKRKSGVRNSEKNR
jgi:hypothetical protein